jgi:hypothetical protein
MSVHYDLAGLRRGNSYERLFRFKEGAGNPVDLTGSEIVFIAETMTSTIRKTTADGSLQMPMPATGEVTLKLTPEETRLFAVGKLRSRYDIERRFGGDEFTILSGCLIVVQGVNDDA